MKLYRTGLRIGIVTLLTLFLFSLVEAQSPVNWIAFIGGTGTDYALYIVRSDGQEQRKLTSNIDRWSFSNGRWLTLAWSPDGQWIAYVGTDGDLYRINIETLEEFRILDNLALLKFIWPEDPDGVNFIMESNPTSSPIEDILWSPDNHTLFLLVQLSPGYSGSTIDLFRIDIQGKNLKQITQNSHPMITLSYAPSFDLEWVAYEIKANCRYCNPPLRGGSIERVHIDGNQLSSFPTQGQATLPLWSLNGNNIYYATWLDDYWAVYNASSTDNRLIVDELPIEEVINLELIGDELFLTGWSYSKQVADFRDYQVIKINIAACSYQEIFKFTANSHQQIILSPDGTKAVKVFIWSDGYVLGVAEQGKRSNIITDKFSEILNVAWSKVPID